VIRVATVIGNPRRESRTHGLARALADAIARTAEDTSIIEVDLAGIGSRVLDPDDHESRQAVEAVTRSDVVVVASPTYKATYSGLTKVFLDRFATGVLAGTRAIPVLLGGAPNHQLAIDVHFAPLLLELGATVPVRGLFVLEADVPEFPNFAMSWVESNAEALCLV
jgi:FMN reductase